MGADEFWVDGRRVWIGFMRGGRGWNSLGVIKKIKEKEGGCVWPQGAQKTQRGGDALTGYEKRGVWGILLFLMKSEKGEE